MQHNPSALERVNGRTVMQIIPELETGGAERTTVEVAQALVDRGARAIVVSEGGRLVTQLPCGGLDHITLPVASKNPLVIWQNAQRLARIAQAEDVDILHVRSRAPAWSALWAARQTRLPLVATYHGIYRAKTALKRLYNSAMVRADSVIANSRYTAQTVEETYRGQPFFDAKKLVVIPRGADLNRFNPDALTSDRRGAANAAFGPRNTSAERGAKGLNVLLPGRLTSWKGQLVMIDALGVLKRRGSKAVRRVVMVGGAQGRDAYAAELEAAIDEVGVRDVVHIHGHWDDMPAAFDWADVAVSASTRPEAFGRVAVEAQAMGCPVIATAHGGALETVDPGNTGWLVAPGYPEELADALNAAAALPSQRHEAMSDRARERVLTLFSAKAMTAATLSVYISHLDRDGAGPVHRGREE